ncbi:VOC family protein [Gorillibacterium sp. sgz5001074]|uniref:VOC family protein n=1 Tax=Gorillibacterium sp. sgz5001074 TaxID=3446695 RepID=UPI003F674A1A
MTTGKMIGGLYETHLEISDLERSVEFYSKLGLTLGLKHAKGAFFWITEPGQQLLGLWLTGEGQTLKKQHFAFQVELEQLLQAEQWLAERGIPLVPQFGREPKEPIVHPWMPAVTVYFEDPDGNLLEFLSMLPDAPVQMPGVLYYSEWRKRVEDGK